MSRITPVRREDMPELEDVYQRAEKALGFLPNSYLAMSRAPEILRAFSRLSREIIGVQGKVDIGLKRLVAYACSRSAGCMYCTAHTSSAAVEVDGVSAEKIEKIFEYETDPVFSDAERTAIAFAQAAGTQPNAVTDADMEEMKKHFTEDQIVEIVAVICMFGWLNRWNDTMATPLEETPIAFGEAHLAATGWEPGKHVA